MSRQRQDLSALCQHSPNARGEAARFDHDSAVRITPLVVLLLLCGCDLLNGENQPVIEEGPDGLGTERPHVLIIAASGHALTVSSGDQEENLVARGTAGRLAEVLSEGGTRLVWVWDHADAFYSRDSAGNYLTPGDNSDFVSFGFLHLVTEMQFAQDMYVEGLEEPTRIVVLGHSHGVVWNHIALQLVPDLPVDLLIDLDGDSTGWDSVAPAGVAADGWDQVILQYNATYGVTWPFEIWAAVDAWQIPGDDTLYDIEDLVPPNVAWNIEVWGSGQILFDADPNVRLGGTTEEIERFESVAGHDDIADPYSDAMEYILNRLTVPAE